MSVLKSMLGSKKFVAMLVGLLATLTAKLGWGDLIDTATINSAVALVISYVVGQGIADAGPKEHAKEQAKQEAAAESK